MTACASLVSELDRLAKALGSNGGAAAPVSLTQVAGRIAKILGVKPDEIAIMGVSVRWKHLYFIVPEALKNIGYIPLSSNSALAARTARQSRPEIVNNFVAVRHATVFEGAKIAGESTEAIQKIISAPVLADGRVVGVIQISRKGPTPERAGLDFMPDDLGKVLALCKPLGKLIQHISSEKE